MVNGRLNRVAGYITECLTKIQSRLQWGSDKYACTEKERLSAEQNCEVILGAGAHRSSNNLLMFAWYYLSQSLLMYGSSRGRILSKMHFRAKWLAGVMEHARSTYDDNAAANSTAPWEPESHCMGEKSRKARR